MNSKLFIGFTFGMFAASAIILGFLVYYDMRNPWFVNGYYYHGAGGIDLKWIKKECSK